MKNERTLNLFLLLTALVFLTALPGCDSNTVDTDHCDIAYASNDDSYVQFVNELDRHIEVLYDDLPLGGTINKHACDLYGVFADQATSFTVQECISGDFDEEGAPVDCGLSGPTRKVQVTVAEGASETITIDGDFF